TDLESQTIQSAARIFGRSERLQYKASCQVFTVVRVDFGTQARSIGYAVEYTAGIEQLVGEEITLRLHADIAIGHEARCERSFGKKQERVTDQKFISNRSLVLAHTDAELRRETEVEICILNDRRSTAKVWHDLIVEIPSDASCKRRPNLAKCEVIDDRIWLIDGEPAVGLRNKSEIQPVIAIGGLKAKASSACSRKRRCRGPRSQPLLIQFALPIRDSDRLIQRLDLSCEIFNRGRAGVLRGPLRFRLLLLDSFHSFFERIQLLDQRLELFLGYLGKP